MLTFRALLTKTATVAERRVMLAGKVEDMINTVCARSRSTRSSGAFTPRGATAS